MYADIIVDISQESLDKTYQYRVPKVLEEKITIGTPVVIPFGNGNRTLRGYVIGLTEQPAIEESRIKDLRAVQEKGIAIEEQFIVLAYWIKEHFGGTMNEALKTVLPVKRAIQEVKRRSVILCSEAKAKEVLEIAVKKKHVAKVRVLEALLTNPKLSYDAVQKKLAIPRATLASLEKEGVLRIEEEQAYRNPIQGKEYGKQKPILNEEQETAVHTILHDYDAGRRLTYLVHGITGSGKTEVYMEVIEHVVAQGKQVIMLIPEIALTFQTVNRFYQRFGDRVSILHSRLSAGERYDQYLRAKRGEIDIMIGPRSALFTPFERLGLIVIDEEHEATYKSETTPKYHARETAIFRAKQTNSSVILGSATPSMEAYYRAEQGEYTLLTLKHRAKKAIPPKIEIVDLREELKKKNRSMFSFTLQEKLAERLERGEQSMLFINRRGYAGFISCRSCGTVIKCPHCDVSLTSHTNGKLLCHYCGYEETMPSVCPSCGSRYIAAFGTGTQKVEEAVKKQFPQARVLRMDADTTKNKAGHEKIIEAFANEEADILIGTQMIVKGHDFPKVTLVGIIAADLSLHAGDYRAAERTYELLSQAAGRAGRDKLPGEVIIQTYQPEHYSVVAAANGNYEMFYEQEMAYRKLMQYPPAAVVLSVLLLGKNEQQVKQAGERLKECICQLEKQQQQKIQCIGPAPAMLSKANDLYRFILYIKEGNETWILQIHEHLEYYKKQVEAEYNCIIQFNFNPMGNE